MRHTFQMNEFDAYKIYLAFKLHFTSEKYDITKTKGAVKFKKESFYKRQDQLSFQRLAEEFTDDTLPKFLIANHIDGNIWGGVFRYEEAVRVYHKWEGRIQSLTENFKTDLEKIVLELAEEDMNKFDADAYDAICELINIINGAYATKLSYEEIEVSLHPPVFYQDTQIKADNGMYVVTFNMKGHRFNLLMVADDKVKLNV